MLSNQENWIPVDTSPGMFSTEYAISLRVASGQDVSFFVDKILVKESGDTHLLKVTLINDFPEQQKKLVLLPTETFETGTRWVEVPV